ncbi:enoyl-CoA hydratase-related protein [Halomonas litopenaei]|uniref:enoyl-CoA hydratase-related protein n=1 Tax=Halomonas litopenaei TaxID=2109328 RepID=UPI001A8F9C80|nr:enoyl-CoA hydratase-related protein [Halomonas litopenaei]MBN8411468.1 enoyl-CoA hydratase/isomerase family protein [Halomonas litopenaei]
MNNIDSTSVISEVRNRVLYLALNRPSKLNALNRAVFDRLMEIIEPLERHQAIGCIVLGSTSDHFCAGADISMLASRNAEALRCDDMFAEWQAFADLKVPKIAAVKGCALGGGCELAMMCDIIYAREEAVFGQPEVKLGLIPGMGGTQRLTRRVGRAKAMELILTGRTISAHQACDMGLVSRVFTADFDDQVRAQAELIASYGGVATRAAVEAIGRAEQTSLAEGLLFERRVYHGLWNTDDCQEGLQAFIDKRPAKVVNR